MEKRYLTKQEVSELTGISISTLNYWVYSKNNIPFIRAGGKILFDIKDVENFLDKNKIRPEGSTRRDRKKSELC